jgi:hypothetical protein
MCEPSGKQRLGLASISLLENLTRYEGGIATNGVGPAPTLDGRVCQENSSQLLVLGEHASRVYLGKNTAFAVGPEKQRSGNFSI